MKIWIVDWFGCKSNGEFPDIYSEVFLRESSARIFYEGLDNPAFKKIYACKDVITWCARHFKQVVKEIVAERDDGNDMHNIYGLVEELKETAAHCGIVEFKADLIWGDVSWETDWDVCFMSVAWLYNGRLEHIMFKLNAVAHPFEHTPLYKRN